MICHSTQEAAAGLSYVVSSRLARTTVRPSLEKVMWASRMAQQVEGALQGKPAVQCFFVEFKGGRRELALPGCPVTSVIVPIHYIHSCFFFF